MFARTRFSPFLPCFSVIWLAAGSASAQLAIDQQNDVSAWSCLNAGSVTMSQSFSPTFNEMNYADLYLSGGSSSAVVDGEFSIRVTRNGSLVRESERLIIPAIPESKYHRFSFADEAFLVNNGVYELELVNHSGSSYFSWCQAQNDSYAGGMPSIAPAFGNPNADFLFRTGVQSVFSTGPAQPTAGDYVYYESAPSDAVADTNGTVVSSNFFSGMNFEVERPTRVSRIGAMFGTGSQQIVGTLFRATGSVDPPDSTDFSTPDVLATTVIDIPSRAFGDPPVEAFGEVDVLLEPGRYGVLFGSGLLGATGQSGLAAVEPTYGSPLQYAFRTSDGSRFIQSSTGRILIEAQSLAGTHQVRPDYDAEARIYNGETWVVIDGERTVRPNLFPFFGNDERGLMEFSLAGLPDGAVVAGATLTLQPDQISGNAQGDSASWTIHGFEGDGVVDAASAGSPLNPIGASPELDNFDPVEIELDVAYLQQLVDGGASHLGLFVRGSNNGLSANYVTWESGRPQDAPLLTFELGPLPGDYDGNGTIGPEDYAVWAASYGATGAALAADGNGDGVVNAADYTFWRDRVPTPTAVPEPRGALLLVGAWLATGYRRRG